MNNQSIFNDEFLNMMSIIGFAIGLYNLQLNEQQTDNDTILKEIYVNRNRLENQDEIYLKQILENQKKIINLLERK